MLKKRFPPLSDMRASGSILREALLLAEKTVEPGVTTEYVDKVVEKFIRSENSAPAFLGYDGFPACCCISVNSQVVHGAPSKAVLKDGDIVSIDCGVLLNGAYSDSARTFGVGDISEEDSALISVTKGAKDRGIEKALPGNRIGNISFAIQSFVEASGFTVSRSFVGHAIGYDLHMQPFVPNYGVSSSGATIREGMFLAVEPIVFAGGWKTTNKDEWNIVSVDGCRSAHFEDTIYIGENGPILMT